VDVFIEAGNKPIGDRESESEFEDRFNRWRTQMAKEAMSRARGRGDVFISTDKVTVCAPRKRKASVLDTVPVSGGGSSLQSMV